MISKRLAGILLVLTFTACLIPVTAVGDNPWDPDSPTDGRTPSSQSSAAPQGDATPEDVIVADDSGPGANGSPQSLDEQSPFQPPVSWWEKLASYFERLWKLVR